MNHILSIWVCVCEWIMYVYFNCIISERSCLNPIGAMNGNKRRMAIVYMALWHIDCICWTHVDPQTLDYTGVVLGAVIWKCQLKVVRHRWFTSRNAVKLIGICLKNKNVSIQTQNDCIGRKEVGEKGVGGTVVVQLVRCLMRINAIEKFTSNYGLVNQCLFCSDFICLFGVVSIMYVCMYVFVVLWTIRYFYNIYT